jgi:2-keto-4-pentenoate hydratase/2-oxohepta-3-ene-1,7-dioic acid hydratase in catechol pathway
MLIARFSHRGLIHYGIAEEDSIALLSPDIFSRIKKTGQRVDRSETTLLPPIDPRLIIGLGRNYLSHINEMKVAAPDRPAIFFKPPRSMVGHMQPIIIPHWASRVDYEGELGVIIGKKMRYIDEVSARKGIFGYTCFNDVTERHIGSSGLINQDISKSCDTFGPCGPWISTTINPDDATIRTILNGAVVQEDNTGRTVFSLGRVLSELSRFMTLMPGDLIITGTPGGIGPLQEGDTVDIEIEGIGRLSNPVRKEEMSV